MKEFAISTCEKQALLILARNSINHYFGIDSKTEQRLQSNSNLDMHCGVFVSLYNNGKLRSCLGRMQSEEPLHELVRIMSVSAATSDSRFSEITASEIPEISIEISVLSPMQLISDINLIQLGKHGIYIKNAYNSGTFLPQVATKTNWTLEEFLGHCSRDKAGLGWNGWKTSEIYIYTSIVFDESILKKD